MLSSSALLQLFAEGYADLVSALRAALKARLTGQARALNDFYAGIEPIEFLKGRARSARMSDGDSRLILQLKRGNLAIGRGSGV
jgi:hypothetical protein